MVISPKQKLFFFCDETSQTTDQFMAVGGIALRFERYHKIRAEIDEINRAYRVRSEVKWSTHKPRRDNVHRAYVDYLFSLIEANYAHFHVLIADFDQFDHRSSGPRLRSDSVSKIYYQLLLHRCAKPYGRTCQVLLRPDNGVCTDYLPKILSGLNSDSRNRGFVVLADPFVSVDLLDSRNEPLLQLNDVVLGAISAFKNKRHLEPNVSAHKAELAAYVLQKTGLPNYDRDTPSSQRRFTVWNFESKREVPPPALDPF